MEARHRFAILAVATLLALGLMTTAASAATLDLYQNTFEGSWPSPGWTVGTNSAVNGTTWGVGNTSGGAPARVHSGVNTLYCAGDAWSAPIWVSGSQALPAGVPAIAAWRGVRIRLRRTTDSGGKIDVDAVRDATVTIEAEGGTGTGVAKNGTWVEESNASFSGGKTMTCQVGVGWIDFSFWGDPDAKTTDAAGNIVEVGMHDISVLVGRKTTDRGKVVVEAFVSDTTDPSGATNLVAGAPWVIDERLAFQISPSGNSYSNNMNGWTRYPLDLRGLTTATPVFWWFIPKGGQADGGDIGIARIVRASDNAVLKEQIFDFGTEYGGGVSRWYPALFDLDEASGANQQVILEFRFRSGSENVSEGMYIDDVSVTGGTRRPPGAPDLSSDTHPDQNVWYDTVPPVVKWPAVSAATGYGWTVDHSPVTTPPTDPLRTELSASLGPLADGQWYFHAAAQRPPLFVGDTNWSEPSNYRLRIDKNAPTISSVRPDEARTDSTSKLGVTVVATDAASGIVRYEYAIGTAAGGTTVRNWTNAGESPHIVASGLRLTRGRSYHMSVRAVDRVSHKSAVAGSGAIYVRKTTKITMRLTKTSLVFGGYTRAYGVVTPKMRNVRVEIRRSGSSLLVASGKTNRLGVYSIKFRPQVSDRYFARRVADNTWATSNAVAKRVGVMWRVTAKMKIHGPGEVMFTGAVTPAPSGRVAYIERKVGRRWVSDVRVNLDIAGRILQGRYRGPFGNTYMRMRVPADRTHASGVSKTFFYRFRRF